MKKIYTSLFLIVFALTGFSQTPYKWDDNVAIGGGGFFTGIVKHPFNNNIVYTRTDVGGAYRLELPNAQHPNNIKWIQMFDWIPVGSVSLFGCSGIAIAPSDTNVVYAALGALQGTSPSDVYKSTNKGVTWTAMALNQKFCGNQFGSERMKGEALAVDPTNANIIFAGTNLAGLWKYNGSAWSQIPSSQIPFGTSPVGIRSVAIDPNNPLKIYCTSFGNGVYQSSDGGTTWSIIPGAPTTAGRLKVTENSILYITNGSHVGGTPAAVNPGVYKYKSGVLSTITPPTTVMHYTAIDADSTQIVVIQTGAGNYNAKIMRSTDEGLTWTQVYAGSGTTQIQSPRHQTWIPYLNFAGNTSSLIIRNNKEVWFCDFAGAYRTLDISLPVTATTPLWEDLPWGDEELVIDDLASPPSGAALFVACYDVEGFRITDPTTIPAVNAWRYSGTHYDAFGIDFCEAHPNFVVRVAANSFSGTGGLITVSHNNGISWTDTYTIGKGAKVTCSATDTTNFLYNEYSATAVNLKYTLNGGTSFSNCNGVPATIWNAQFYDAFSKPVTSDRINGNKFYAFSGGTVYVSTDKGQNFSAAATGLPLGGNGTGVPHRSLEASPYAEGDLWFANDNTGLYHSTNSGASFIQIPFFNQCYQASVGPAIGSSTYPTVYAFGKKAAGNIWGLYRSVDNGATWIRINDNAHQLSNGPRALEADRQTPGRIYMGSGGRGVYMGVDTTLFNPVLPGAFTLALTPECIGTASQIRLNWTASTNATSYDVYRNGVIYTTVTAGTQYINTTVTTGTSYTYFVKAKNSAGGTNNSNGTLSATAPDCLSPLPGSFTVTLTPECNGTMSRVRLNWTTSNNAVSYDIYRNGVIYATVTSGTQYINTPVTVGTTYSYYIKANNTAGSIINSNGSLSATAPDCSSPLPGPFTLILTPECNGTTSRNRLVWTISTNATSYDIYKDGNLDATGLTGTQYIDSGLAVGVSNTYFVQARNVVGGLNNSNGILSATPLNCAVPVIFDSANNLFEIKVYPNPSSGKFFITANNTKNKNIKIEISNEPGQKIYSMETIALSDIFTRQIDITKSAHSVYFIKISIDEKRFVRKIITQ